jgi:hypothetical protein
MTPTDPETVDPCEGPDTLERVAALPRETLLPRYRRGVENFDRRLFSLSPEQYEQAFLPDAGVGRWPVRVLLGHIADAEIVYTHRMRRTVAEDNPVLAVWDPDAFVDGNLYGLGVAGDRGWGAHTTSMGGFLAVVHTLRLWTSDWLATLVPEQWQRQALHPERGPLTVHQMVGMATWHLEHHARFLKAKLDRFFGAGKTPVPEGTRESCGPGCGCARPTS